MAVPEKYDEWTVSKIEDELADLDDPETVEEWHDYEKANKDRVTANDAYRERLDELESESAENDDSASETDESESPPDDAERIRVRNPKGRGQHIAGFSFKPGEAKLIPVRPDVQKAIRSGNLQYVGPR